MELVPVLMGSSKKLLAKPAEIDRDRATRLELEAAKQILAEIFSVRPHDVDDMIIKRLEDRFDSYLTEFAEANCQGEERKGLEGREHERWGFWPEMLQI
jgi:hypothetical protein